MDCYFFQGLLFDIFQTEKSEDKKVVGKSNIKDASVLHYSSEESDGHNSPNAASQKVVKVIAKTKSNLFLSPCETWTYYLLY